MKIMTCLNYNVLTSNLAWWYGHKCSLAITSMTSKLTARLILVNIRLDLNENIFSRLYILIILFNINISMFSKLHTKKGINLKKKNSVDKEKWYKICQYRRHKMWISNNVQQELCQIQHASMTTIGRSW